MQTVCIYTVCMRACTCIHNLILSYGAFDSLVQKWNFYCSYLHTCLYTVQKQQPHSLQLSLSLKKRCKHGFGLFFSSLKLCCFSFGDFSHKSLLTLLVCLCSHMLLLCNPVSFPKSSCAFSWFTVHVSWNIAYNWRANKCNMNIIGELAKKSNRNHIW